MKPENDDSRPTSQQFGLGWLFLLLGVMSIAAAAAHYLYKAIWTNDHRSRLVALLVVLAAPALVTVVVSLLSSIFRRRSDR
ncbi:MAG: hypothetical protein QGG36_01015 [Pirellulaceae bacterium]|nr:hypothetical protein [Pirellulaceae bacterium]